MCDNINHDFYVWLSGFIDGEGHFGLYPNHGSVLSQFRLNIRDDDHEIIKEIRNRLGFGTICHIKAVKIGHPQICFEICDHSSCMIFVGILDNHPLKSKKARDYAVWREAVIEINRQGTSRSSKKLEFLMSKIKRIRQYPSTLAHLSEFPIDKQLEFIL